MTTKTYPELGAQTTVEDADLLASWRSLGPLKKVTAAVLKDYVTTDIDADNIEFDPGYTDSVPRPISSALRDRMNSTPQDFVTDGGTVTATVFQEWLDHVAAAGGTHMMPARDVGDYDFSSQVTLTPAAKSINLLCSGAVITTVGAISGFKIVSGGAPYSTRIVGLQVFQPGNAAAIAGFEQVGASHVTWEECSAYANGGVSAGYGGWLLRQADPDDSDTGCFWTRFPGSAVRSTGVGGFVPNGVILNGGQNATNFSDFFVTGADNAILMTVPTGTTLPVTDQPTANSVRIVGSWIEGCANAVRFEGAVGGYGPFGLLIDSRMESLDYILSMSADATLNSQEPPVIILGQTLSNVTEIIDNPNSLQRTILDYRGFGSQVESRVTTQRGWRFRGVDAAYDVLMIEPQNTGSGLIITGVGGSISTLRARETGGRMDINGDSGIRLGYIKGISGAASAAFANNLRGQVTFTGGATKAVTFGTAEADASYYVSATGNVNETFWVTAKGTGGFTINSSNPTSTAIVDWHLIR